MTPEEVAAAAMYLKNSLGKDGIQELISSLSKDKGKSLNNSMILSRWQTIHNSIVLTIFMVIFVLWATADGKILVEDIARLGSLTDEADAVAAGDSRV